MEYNEFVNNIKHTNKRNHKIGKCYGIKDYYEYYNSIKPGYKKYRIGFKQYSDIINLFHLRLIERLFEYKTLPLYKVGHIEIQKYINAPKLVDGELVYKAPVDWKKTYELWYEDEEERESKTLVKIQNRDNHFFRFKFFNRYYRY